jgi:hypothetical protein
MAGSRVFFSRLVHRVGLLSRLTRVGRIAVSGLFDKEQYRRNYPGLSAIWRRFPIVHYVLIGERIGYAPFESFDPVSYASMYDDVPDYPQGALMHYIRHGQYERRVTRSPLDAQEFFEGEFPKVPSWAQTERIAVVVHVFYLDVWKEIAAALAKVDFGFDLIVTVPDGPDFDPVAEAIETGDVPVAYLQRQPNVGRDILGFIHLVNSGLLSRYDAVCKLHTKKSPHLVDGDVWRRELTHGLLPSPGGSALVSAFLEDDNAQLLVPDQFLFKGHKWWTINKPLAEQLISGTDLKLEGKELVFAAGSMFWLKPRLIEEIRRHNFVPSQFVTESGQYDGTTAHAFERLTGLLCRQVSGRIAVLSEMQVPKEAAASGAKSEFKMITGPTR